MIRTRPFRRSRPANRRRRESPYPRVRHTALRLPRRSIASLFVVLVAITTGVSCGPATPASPVLVIVNGRPITQAEFDYRWEALPASVQERYRNEGGKRKFLDDLIARELLLQEARKLGLDRDVSLRERVERYKEQLVLDALTSRAFDPEITITDAELDRYIAAQAGSARSASAETRNRLRHELHAARQRERYEAFLARLRAEAVIRMADASRYVLQDAGRTPTAPRP